MRLADEPVGDLDLRREAEHRVGLDEALLQGAGDRDDLEGGARLVDVADGPVLPGGGRCAGHVVGVHARPVGHREHLARARVRHERGRALRLVRLADAAEDLLGLGLDLRVERELDVVPRLHRGRVPDRDRLAEGVAHDPPLAVLAVQRLLLAVLQARAADAVGLHGAEDLRRQPVARVLAAARRREVDAGDVELADLRGAPRGQLAREVDEAAALGELVEQVAHRDAEDRGELRGRAPRVLDEVRRRGDVARGLGHRELGAGAVGDRPALRGERDVDDLLRRGGVLEGAGVDETDPAGAQDGDAEQDEEDREEQADAALRQPHRA